MSHEIYQTISGLYRPMDTFSDLSSLVKLLSGAYLPPSYLTFAPFLPTELSDKSVSSDEQQRLKLAFAEGYLSGGSKQSNTGWGGRLFQGLYNVLRIAAIVLLIYVIFGGSRWGMDGLVGPCGSSGMGVVGPCGMLSYRAGRRRVGKIHQQSRGRWLVLD